LFLINNTSRIRWLNVVNLTYRTTVQSWAKNKEGSGCPPSSEAL